MNDHDHDLDYAEKHHRHYDLERQVDDLRGQVRKLRAILIEFGLDLSEAQGRIHQLEQQTPEARQAEYEAAVALADAAESGYGESWRSTLADYQVASGCAEYVDEEQES